MADLGPASAPQPTISCQSAAAELPVAALLDVLELPPAALAHWFAHVDRFCEQHGGARRYALLQALMREGLAAVAARAEETDAA